MKSAIDRNGSKAVISRLWQVGWKAVISSADNKSFRPVIFVDLVWINREMVRVVPKPRLAT